MTMVISFEICDGGRLGYKLDQIGIGYHRIAGVVAEEVATGEVLDTR